MTIRNLFKTITLAATLAAATVMAQTPYDEGQKALREQNWTQAEEHFQQAIKTDKEHADAAMYWRAHALYKAGRRNEAERQIRSLARKHPESRWMKEAQLLQIEYQDGIGPVGSGAPDESGLDEELRLFALAQLMQRDPERALPLVLELANQASSDNTRMDALFVLGMSDDPAAQSAIADFARDSSKPELQMHAVQILGAASTESSLELLSGLYTESASDELKTTVIHAYAGTDQPGILLDLLKTEKNPALQREMIHTLGAMDATSELQALYPTLSDQGTRIAAIEAISMSGESDLLRQLLSTETDPELRRAIIFGIAMEDRPDTVEVLEAAYRDASGIEEKSAILEALVMVENADELALKIIRDEKEPELQRQAIHVLGMMDANEQLGSLYNSLDDPETRMAVLQALAIADDTERLIEILKTEKDENLRSAAIQSLAISDSEAAAAYLINLYPQASRGEKSAVIQAMMIMENAEGLLNLLKQETDPQLKREMLQMLSVMESETSDDYLFELLEKNG
jgi:HEAT repeat protein